MYGVCEESQLAHCLLPAVVASTDIAEISVGLRVVSVALRTRLDFSCCPILMGHLLYSVFTYHDNVKQNEFFTNCVSTYWLIFKLSYEHVFSPCERCC